MNRAQFIQLGIALSVLVILCALAVGTSVYLQSLTAHATQLGQDVAQKQAETVRVASAREALPVLEEAERVITAHVVRQSDIVSFLEQLEKQGRAQGATVKVLSVNPVQSETDTRIIISLTASGTFDAVLRSVGAIEYGPYDIVLTAVTITTVPSEEVKGGWNAAVTLSVGTSGEVKPEKK